MLSQSQEQIQSISKCICKWIHCKMSQTWRQIKMIKSYKRIEPYRLGDKNYKVKRTYDGRFAVYDSTKKDYIVATFDADEESEAYESAENRNKENDANFVQHLKYIADLKKQAHSFTPESFFRYMDGLIVENMKTFMR